MKNPITPPTPYRSDAAKSIDEKLLRARAMAERVALVDGKRTYTPMRSDDIRSADLGALMGHAVLREDKEGMRAIGWIYVHRHPSDILTNFLPTALDVLIDEDRPDLFPRLVQRLHSTCMAVWTHDRPQRAGMVEPLKGAKLPDQQNLDLDIIEDVRGSSRAEGVRGLAAWVELGRSMKSILWSALGNGEVKDYLTKIKALYDVLDHVEDTRAWTPEILYRAVRHPLGNTTEADQAWLGTVCAMARYLTDAGAAAWVRSMADEMIGWDGPRDDPAQISTVAKAVVPLVIDQHPRMTLDDWLCLGIPGELEPDFGRLEGGSSNARLRKTLKESPSEDLPCSDGHLGNFLGAYEQMVTWVGADKGPELSDRTAGVLKTLLQRHYLTTDTTPTSTLQAALDLRDLRDVAGVGGPDGSAVPQKPRRSIL